MSDNQLDKDLSSACTKAGAFILLLSLTIVTLSFQWVISKYTRSASRYITLRWSLKQSIEMLEIDPCWEIYLEDNKEAELLPLEKLEKLKCSGPAPAYGSVRNIPKIRKDDETIPNSKEAPPKALNLTIFGPNREIKNIISVFLRLQDPELLKNSPKGFHQLYYIIDNWLRKRNKLFDRKLSPDPKISMPNEQKKAAKNIEVTLNPINSPKNDLKKKKPYAPPVDKLPKKTNIAHKQTYEQFQKYLIEYVPKDAILKYFALRDVKELANYYYPESSTKFTFSSGYVYNHSVKFLSLPKNIFSASMLVSGLLFFMTMYFAALVKEAVSSKNFPAPGTLFSVFSGSKILLLLFFLTICFPFIASLVLSIVSKEWKLYLFVLLIFASVFDIQITLYRTGFFKWKG